MLTALPWVILMAASLASIALTATTRRNYRRALNLTAGRFAAALLDERRNWPPIAESILAATWTREAGWTTASTAADLVDLVARRDHQWLTAIHATQQQAGHW